MDKIETKEFAFYRFRQLAGHAEVVHFVSSGMRNIGFSEGGNAGQIRQNRLLLARAVGIDPERWVTGHQIHSDRIAVVTGEDAGRGGLDRISRLPDTDGLVTDRRGICLMVLSADCVPVLLYDPWKKVIAAVHAGWRGTAAHIAAKAVTVMKDRFGCLPERILAGIGPSIGPCCFEVDEKVAGVFRELFSSERDIVVPGQREGKFQVDLWEANRMELIETGVKNSNIELAGMCSVCHSDRFFSYRRDGIEAGRFGAGICLK